jgi:hypothetical protein
VNFIENNEGVMTISAAPDAALGTFTVTVLQRASDREKLLDEKTLELTIVAPN